MRIENIKVDLYSFIGIQQMTRRLFLSTLPSVSNRPFREIGLVSANLVKTRHIGYHLMGEIRTIFGGNVKSYTDLLSDTRKEVTQDLIAKAEEIQADGIIGIRYQNSDIVPGTSEILVYGTAIKFDSPE